MGAEGASPGLQPVLPLMRLALSLRRGCCYEPARPPGLRQDEISGETHCSPAPVLALSSLSY